jgi:hypothetical protein
MLGFDFFRRPHSGYMARTPGAAMRAVEAEILPLEAYVTIATGARSMIEEPYSLDELERLLSREDLDIDTNIMLVRIFERLVKGHDAEVALIAAEGINLIENRYNTRIEALKRSLEDGDRKEPLYEVARLYWELAQLYEHSGSIRKFYLREAHSALARLRRLGPMSILEIELMVHVLLDLDIPEQAAAVLEAHTVDRGPEVLMLRAEVEFSRGDYLKVLELCSFLIQSEEQLPPAHRELVSFWLDR